MTSNLSQGNQQLPEIPRQKIDVVVKRTFIDMPVRSSNSEARRASLPASLDRISTNGEIAKLVASRRGSISDVSTELQLEEEHLDDSEQGNGDVLMTATNTEVYSEMIDDMMVAQWPSCPFPAQPQILSTTFQPSQLEAQSPVASVSPSRRQAPMQSNFDCRWQSMGTANVDDCASPERARPAVGSYRQHLQSIGNAALDNSSSPRRRPPMGYAGSENQWKPPMGNTLGNSMSPNRRRSGTAGTLNESPNRRRAESGMGAQMRWPAPTNSPEKSVSPQRRTALSSKAQAWQPPAPAQNARFNNQAADVMAKLEVALLSGEWDVDVVIKKDGNNFTVSVSMRLEEIGNWALVMAEAQEVLLRAAKESSCVYVLGYESQPFQPLENGYNGFIATLAEMRDEAAACWETYAIGSCQSGNGCSREHPPSLAYVILKLVD